ncbi:hypothetical protein [Paracoccus sp. MKU1]|uniref:hypothetical protein n=1 Tax=Paracoccus sp. MKU1 TaxID=1745182 RepID=UPI0007191349|nr:hypothetical protein [Paracoccus sp. MKU1]KRW94323.1 hypothetical protein AQY21_20555 [Paracoccus sp. MKU1]
MTAIDTSAAQFGRVCAVVGEAAAKHPPVIPTLIEGVSEDRDSLVVGIVEAARWPLNGTIRLSRSVRWRGVTFTQTLEVAGGPILYDAPLMDFRRAALPHFNEALDRHFPGWVKGAAA